MNTQDVSNLLVAVGLLNQMVKQASEVSNLIHASGGKGLKLEDLRVIVQKRDAAIAELDRAIAEGEQSVG